jgi:Family of unknown function (DUF5670)
VSASSPQSNNALTAEVLGSEPLKDDLPNWAIRRRTMLETIAVILVVLWVLGFVSSYTMGGLIHILLVVAVVVILVRVIQGRRL